MFNYKDRQYKHYKIFNNIAYADNVFSKCHSAVLLDRIVAVVNNEVITWSELRNVISHEGKSFLDKVPEDKKEEVMKELEKNFLNSLIDMKLQLRKPAKRVWM